MGFELYNYGKDSLRNTDNSEWIDMITCWVEKEQGYNIYIFQVIVNNQKEIENYYATITASIAVEFQTKLRKAIEKWNIYLIFECEETVDWKIKAKVEQDKYAVRKMVCDDLSEKELEDRDYLRKRLLSLSINDLEEPKEKISLYDKIAEKDLELYTILRKSNLDINKKVALYIGDGIDE